MAVFGANAAKTGGGRPQGGLGATDVVLPIALLLSFSVSILDLATHWLANPWTRYSLIFAPLVAWVARNEGDKRRHPRLGALLIVAAVTTQLFAVMADTLALSRPALVVALIGFLINRGFASKRCALVSIFIVPIPYSFAKELGGSTIAEATLSGAADQLGIAYSLHRNVFETTGSAGAGLEVSATFGGAPLLALALGLAAYQGLRLRRSAAQTLATFLRWLVVLIPLQLLALGLAVVLLDRFGANAAAVLLDRVVWLTVAATIIYQTEHEALGAGG